MGDQLDGALRIGTSFAKTVTVASFACCVE
jgi:hypothetical protein